MPLPLPLLFPLLELEEDLPLPPDELAPLENEFVLLLRAKPLPPLLLDEPLDEFELSFELRLPEELDFWKATLEPLLPLLLLLPLPLPLLLLFEPLLEELLGCELECKDFFEAGPLCTPGLSPV